MGQGQQIVKSDNVGRENIEYLKHTCLMTDNYSMGVGWGVDPQN